VTADDLLQARLGGLCARGGRSFPSSSPELRAWRVQIFNTRPQLARDGRNQDDTVSSDMLTTDEVRVLLGISEGTIHSRPTSRVLAQRPIASVAPSSSLRICGRFMIQ
jgi:hypothetical protein